MMIGTLYVARDSPVHRLAPGLKLVAIPLLGTPLFFTGSPLLLGGALVSILALYALARIPPKTLIAQVRSVIWLLAIFFAAQLWLSDLTIASATALRFLALVLLAALVTLTTRTAVLTDALERALSHLSFLGVDAAKVGLAISLVFRFIPVIHAVMHEVREAQIARGQDRSILGLVVPLIVRTLKMADEVADAIDARS